VVVRTRRPESSLTAPAMAWLTSRGAGSILGEVCNIGNCLADLVAWFADGDMVAVELKVSDWRRALAQAARNRWHVDYSWVGMAEEYVAPAARNLPAFEEAGVGLVAVGTESARVILEARRVAPADRLPLYCGPLAIVIQLITAPLDGEFDLGNTEAIDYVRALETGEAFVRRSSPRESALRWRGVLPAKVVKPRRPQTPHDPEVARQIMADLGLTGEP